MPVRKNNRAEVLQILEAAAAAGAPPPQNADIGAALGIGGNAVEWALKSLRMQGVIALEREGQSRRFTIVPTGAQTAWASSGAALRESLRVAPRTAALEAAVLAEIRRAVSAGEPAPGVKALMDSVGCSRSAIDRTTERLVAANAVQIEVKGGRRRIYIDGAWTKWSGAGPQSPGGKKLSSGMRQQLVYRNDTPSAKLQKRLYEHLVGLAEVAAPMPTNDDLMVRFSASIGAIEAALRRMRGSHIHSERDGNSRRRLVIVATGKATGWSVAGVTPQGVPMSFVNPAMAIPCSPRNGGKDWAPWRTCQFIAGDPRDRNFCGAPTREGSSYCHEHHALCNVAGSADRRLEAAA